MAELMDTEEESSWNQVLATIPPEPAKPRLTGGGRSGSTAPSPAVIGRIAVEDVKGKNIFPRLCRSIREVLIGLSCLDSSPAKAAFIPEPSAPDDKTSASPWESAKLQLLDAAMALYVWQKAVAESELERFFDARLFSGESESSALRAARSHLLGLGQNVLHLVDAASESLGKLKEPILRLEQLVVMAEEEIAWQRGLASARVTEGLSLRTILDAIRQASRCLGQIDVRKALYEADLAKLTRSSRIELDSGGPLSPTTPSGRVNICPTDFRTFDFRSSPSDVHFLPELPFHQFGKNPPFDGDTNRRKVAPALLNPLQHLQWPPPPSSKKARRPHPTPLGSSWSAAKEATMAVLDTWYDSRPPVGATAEDASSLGDEPLNVTVFVSARQERLTSDEIRATVEDETAAAAAADGASSDAEEDDLMELVDMLSRVRVSERTLPEGTLSAIREAVDQQNPHRQEDLMSTEAARSDAEVRKSLEFAAALLEKLSLATVYANARARPLAEALGLSMQTIVLDEFFDSSARWFSKHSVPLPDTKEHADARSFLNAQYWRVTQVRDSPVAAGLSEVWDRLLPRLDNLVARLRHLRAALDLQASRRPAGPGSKAPHKRSRYGSVDDSSGRPYDAPVSLPPLQILCYILPQQEGEDQVEDDGTMFFEEVSLGAFFHGGRLVAEPASTPPATLPQVKPADGVGPDDIMTEDPPRDRGGEGADVEIHKASPVETADLMVCAGTVQEATSMGARRGDGRAADGLTAAASGEKPACRELILLSRDIHLNKELKRRMTEEGE